ncbi:Down syndrome cell adhesion molecule-like protein Dscam2, partial [Leptotrombidium deliense]
YNGDVVSFVNISNIRLEDGGLYNCEAINDAGNVSHSETIAVIGAPFIKVMKNITVLAGHTMLIRCPVSGYPISKISWSRGGRQLPINERTKVFENGSLIIIDANRELDEGNYICTAINEKGEKATRNLHIQVLSKHKQCFNRTFFSFFPVSFTLEEKPVISAFSFPQSLTEGMQMMITC